MIKINPIIPIHKSPAISNPNKQLQQNAKLLKQAAEALEKKVKIASKQADTLQSKAISIAGLVAQAAEKISK